MTHQKFAALVTEMRSAQKKYPLGRQTENLEAAVDAALAELPKSAPQSYQCGIEITNRLKDLGNEIVKKVKAAITPPLLTLSFL